MKKEVYEINTNLKRITTFTMKYLCSCQKQSMNISIVLLDFLKDEKEKY